MEFYRFTIRMTALLHYFPLVLFIFHHFLKWFSFKFRFGVIGKLSSTILINHQYVRLYAKFDVVVSLGVNLVEAAWHDGSPLCNESGDEEVVPHSTKTILLQEGHQKAETDVEHDMDILEHCKDKGKAMLVYLTGLWFIRRSCGTFV